jgi:DNA-directed RNA polymerase subunit K/omega
MPPKKVIKLLEKTEKPEKIIKPVAVDSDEVEEESKEEIIKPKQNLIIKKPIKETPDPIIKDDDEEQDLENPVKKAAFQKNRTKAAFQKSLAKTPEGKKSEKDEIIIDESEIESKPKIKQAQSIPTSKPKQKTNSLLKQTESSFDMFGDDKDDYREILMNYDYTKNKTLPKITKYERALLVGKRAKQIEDGANPNVKVKPGQSAIEIAEEELRQRKIPFIIKRPNGNTFEYWKPADMEVFMD